MNRTIEFRGLRTYGKEWVYGYYFGGYSWADFIIEDAGFENRVQVIPETVGQFTGIKDKNGLKIYEGDLLSDPYPIDEEDLSKGYHESLLPVIWCNVKLQWCVDTSFSKDGSFLFSLVEYFGNNLEVKGNVYEKELEVKL